MGMVMVSGGHGENHFTTETRRLGENKRDGHGRQEISAACRFGTELEWLRKQLDARAAVRAAAHFNGP